MLAWKYRHCAASAALLMLAPTTTAMADPPVPASTDSPDVAAPEPSATAGPWDRPGPWMPRHRADPDSARYATAVEQAQYRYLPPGIYHLESKPWETPIIAGAVMLVTGELGSAIGASFALANNVTSVAPLYIPILGPWITLGVVGGSGGFDAEFGGFSFALVGLPLIVDGVLQGAGTVLLAVGASGHTTIVKDGEAPQSTTPQVGIAGNRIVIEGRF